MHPLFPQIDVETGNLGVEDPRLHRLTGDGAVERVTLDVDRLSRALSVRFEYVYGLYRITNVPPLGDGLDGEHGIYGHGREEIVVAAQNLAGHARLGDVDESFATERIDLVAELLVHEFDGLFAGETVAGDDGRRVDLHLHEVVRSS